MGVLALPSTARAQAQKKNQNRKSQNEKQAPDVVYLVDGTQITGKVLKQVPGQYVTIQRPDGRQVTVAWSDVRRVEMAAPSSPAAPAPPTPSQAPTAQPAPAKAPASTARKAAPGPSPTAAAPPAAAPPAPNSTPAPPATRGPTTTTLNANAHGAKFQQTSDCSSNPNAEICKRHIGMHAGKGGVGFGLSQTSVTRVKTRPSTVLNFAAEGFFVYGTEKISQNVSGVSTSTSVSIYGGGANVGMKLLTGQRFPGPQGGSWNGAAIEGMVGFFGAGMVMQTKSSLGDSTDGAGMTMFPFGANVSYQYLRFGEMSPGDLHQRGWGFKVGAHLGGQQTKVISGQTTTTTDFSYGPVLALLFPDYNAGTARLQSGYVQAMILPTGKFFFMMIGGGGAF